METTTNTPIATSIWQDAGGRNRSLCNEHDHIAAARQAFVEPFGPPRRSASLVGSHRRYAAPGKGGCQHPSHTR